MKKCLLFSFLLFNSLIMIANKQQETAIKEAERFIKKDLLAHLQTSLSKEGPNSVDDLLPSWDKGKRFSPNDTTSNEELTQMGQSAISRENINSSERALQTSSSIIKEPHKSLGIKEKRTPIPEEIYLVKCVEGGEYEAKVIVDREVIIHPEKTKEEHTCLGHKKKKNFLVSRKAYNFEQALRNKFKKDQKIEPGYKIKTTYSETTFSSTVTYSWKHKQGVKCKKSRSTVKLIEERKEEDNWKADDPQLLAFLEKEPTCQLYHTQTLLGPSTHQIDGESVFRETWREQQCFQCHGAPNSKCQTYRNQQALLVRKKCIKETPFGECITWEKTYDLGKKRAFLQAEVDFAEEPLYGYNLSLPETEKNQDIGEIASTFSVLSELKQDLEKNETDPAQKKAEIFKGEAFACSRSLIHGILYDCCKKMDGVAIAVKLAECSAEEKCLSKNRYDGKCHFVGTKRKQLETKQVYCCFPTKLARIVHEEGRKQLKYSWGSPNHPKCRGFSLQQFRKINFSKMDLSELLEDMDIDREEFLKKLNLKSHQLNQQPTFNQTEERQGNQYT